jgi:hypothetical protein
MEIEIVAAGGAVGDERQRGDESSQWEQQAMQAG